VARASRFRPTTVQIPTEAADINSHWCWFRCNIWI